MKTTVINAEDIFKQQERPGFVPVCGYGHGMDILDGEIGSICRFSREPPKLEHGLFVTNMTRLERIVVRQE